MNKAKLIFKPKEHPPVPTPKFKRETLTPQEKEKMLLILAEKSGLLE